MRGLAFTLVVLALSACQKADKSEDKQGGDSFAKSTTGPAGATAARPNQPPATQQVPPPFDLKNPPADAVKRPSGLIMKMMVQNPSGASPKRNDTVMINWTGWKQSNGETFFTNRSRNQPMPLNLTSTAPGFIEAMQMLHKGDKAMLWLPPSIGYKGPPQPNAETLVYEIEIADIVPAPPIPEDVANPPAKAETTKDGIKYVVVRQGTGKDKPRSFDNVTFHYTAWDAEGRMFDSTETKKRPTTIAPYKQPGPFEEILTSMTAGERVRFWAPADKMAKDGKPMVGMPQGQLCYEVEIEQIAPGIEPPQTPADVAKPPADAKKTAKGVSYKVLKPGKGGPHPKPSDVVRVHYSGWTTDGKMFDSSVTRGEPAEFSLSGVIMGWTDGIPVMSVGDKVRFWIPEELAYKGQPGRPQGMLVFDVELLEIKPPAHADMPPHP